MAQLSRAVAINRNLNKARKKEEEPETWVLVVEIELTDRERGFEIVQECRSRHDSNARGFLFKDYPVYANCPVEEYLP